MKYKLAIIETGFMKEYIKYFLELCEINNIEVDIFSFSNTKLVNPCINKEYLLKTKLKQKDINSKIKLENEIKNLVEIDDYDYFLIDSIGLSFTCNILHNLSLKKRLSVEQNFLIRWILYFGHLNKILKDRKYYKNAQKIFAVSNIAKKDYIENYKIDEDKIAVVYPGMSNKKEVKTEIYERNKDSRFVIGAITCGFATKGGYNVLGSIRKVIKHNKNIKVKIINPKAKKQILLKLYIWFFHLSEYVEFYPYFKNIDEFYKELDCLICASRYEAFGRIVTEAIDNGVPTIVGSNIGSSEILKDNETSFIFEANKNLKENLMLKLMYLIENKNKMETLKNKAKETIKNYTWENFAKNIFEKLYKDNCIQSK